MSIVEIQITSTMAESEGKDIVICGDSFVKRLKYYCEITTYIAS